MTARPPSAPAPHLLNAPQGSGDEPEFEINLGEYFGMARRHWKLLTAALVLAVGASVAQYAVTPRVYTAQATVQIERRGMSPLVNSQNPWLDAYNLEFYPTQYKLLESRGLAERVVKSMDLMSDPGLNPRAGAAPVTTGPRIASLKGIRDGVRTSAQEDQATLGRLADQLRGGLSVEPIRNTELVVLSYQHTSAEFAAKAANGFAEAFIDMGVENRYATAGKASSFLGSQIATLKREIDGKEKELQAFSRKKDIVALQPGSSVVLQRLESLNSSYIDAKKARIAREASYHELTATPADRLADTVSGGMVSDLRAEQIRLERDYETKLKTYKPGWPGMIDLETQIEKGRQHMAQVVKENADKALQGALTAYQTALRQEQGLEAELNKMKSAAMDQSSESVQYSNLRSELASSRQMLDELLRRQSETAVTANLQDTHDSNVHIIDHALIPSIPSYPSLRKSVSSGLLIGLLLGIGTIFLIEFLDRTLKTPEEVERRLVLPTLAVIPDLAEAGRGYGYAGQSEAA
ncbi:MAG: GumC family protein, partial [Acidobacteriota bacterium]|nr:GumC family protein [Acidobacteriota bacterium]